MALVETAPVPAGFSRRQVLKVVGATAAVAGAIGAARLFGPQPQFHTWTGLAMGGTASLTLWHSDPDYAARTVARMLSEVGRLESVFSLYTPTSEISRLNRDGTIANASPDFVSVVHIAQDIGAVSGGAFDVTVQPLWRLYEAHFATPGADPLGPPAAALREAVRLVDYTAIEAAGRAVRLGHAGMSLTLNAVAQGYITDRIADLLRNEGFDHVAVGFGETRVIGAQPDGAPWEIGIRDRTGSAARSIGLTDEALSVSGGYGTVFEPSGRSHHILDPDTGRSADGVTTVAVAHPRATIADGLSTAIVVAGEGRAPALLAAHPGARAIITRGDGSFVEL